ncbi:MAG: hypothetical protein M0Z46_12700 [Actinomycetota bacterium]|jgi:hypothetical protein|nr:hypothetical protein [Actinomycetota bacterium]
MATTPPVSDPIDLHTVECPECGTTISHLQANVAKMLLGKHRSREHGVAGKSAPKAKRKGARPPVREDQPAPIRVAKTIADELPEGKKTPPNAADLTKAFGKGLGALSTMAASWAAESDPTVTSETDLDAITDYLSLSPEASREIAYPFAKFFAKSKLNKRMGSTIVENVDMVSAAAELIEYAHHWRRYLAERRRREEAQANARPQTTPGPQAGNVVRDAPVNWPAPGTGEMATGPVTVPSMNGHVVDANEVRRMRGER